jgi:serine phosphatase RsbU (regulator of sigma subunit)
MSFQLDSGTQLTLLTDGVVEARGKDGNLMGFDKAAGMSRESAESIASAAEHFGQEDDITVVTLSRVSQAPPEEQFIPGNEAAAGAA